MTSSHGDRGPDDLDFLRQVLREMTHEIAAPLTPLFGHLDLLELRAQEPLTPMQTRCIHAMRRSLRRLSAINDGMLELARLERGHIPCEPTSLSPGAAVVEVVRLVSKEAMTRGVELRSEVDETSDAQVLADWNLLVTALGHLVDNALRYAPEHSAVRVSTHLEGDACAFHVADEGVGVPDSELERIVRPFYRLTDQDAYTETAGLGLPIVELIAQRQGGRLSLSPTHAEREEQRGLTACLEIPLVA